MMEAQNTLNSGMCRCCSSEGTFKDIKTTYRWMGEEEVYAEMLTDCFDIKIQTPEDMDNGICELCITQLRNALNFKKQVLHTEEQFKRRMQGRDVKNPIKIESVEDSIESDHLSDQDFTEEYEVPIKVEIEEKPKAKKRPAKPATPRAKKAKSEPESSQHGRKTCQDKKVVNNLTTEPNTKIKTEAEDIEQIESKNVLSNSTQGKEKNEIKNQSVSRGQGHYMKKEMRQHKENLSTILRCSDATLIRNHSNLGYTCYFCNTSYREASSLKKHTKDNHSYKDQPFIKGNNSNFFVKLDITDLHCKLCGQSIDQLEQLSEHLIKVHNEPFHKLTKSVIIPFKFEKEELKCAVCSQEFNNFHSLLDHMRKHYRNFICDVCDEGYLSYHSLKTHRLGHNVGEYTCKECNKLFSSTLKLKNHTRVVHLGIKRNKCGYCGEKFAELNWKLDHLEKVHGVKKPEYECTVCNKKFSCAKTLNSHKRGFHLLEKNQTCPDCGMKFFRKHTLKHHMTTHTGLRAFECVVCSKAFSRRSSLREHMRIHDNDRRFKCEHCNMAFVQKCSWKAHMRSKHGEDIT
ncbi:zinc finger protein 260-like isoform X3 [Leguminivora glycinivorella]|uniref:zinc finger protein 260-like isoform X3 n=1 Tax=Leguminivora glycinivorella TaxID=1035111 RepID=UPI00200FEDCA|nr:zinc finger protein 260-like isoform X3 [Leguminivora glycinivorella]